MCHEDIEDYLRDLVKLYNDVNKADPVETAYKLFLKFLEIHPFRDGNRRMGQLLVVYHLCISGTPFPVTITSGKSEYCKDY